MGEFVLAFFLNGRKNRQIKITSFLVLTSLLPYSILHQTFLVVSEEFILIYFLDLATYFSAFISRFASQYHLSELPEREEGV